MRRRLWLAALSGGLMAVALHFGRGWPWSYSLVVGLGAAILVYSAWRTGDRLRNLYRR